MLPFHSTHVTTGSSCEVEHNSSILPEPHKITRRVKGNVSLESKTVAGFDRYKGYLGTKGPLPTPTVALCHKPRIPQPCRQHRVNYPPVLRSTKVHHCNMSNIYIASLCSLNRFWLNNEQTVLQTPMRIPKL